jgi:hypothetical protein
VITQFSAEKYNTNEVKVILHTRSGKQFLRLIFNFVPSDLAMLLFGMLGDAKRSHGKSGYVAFKEMLN